MNIKDLKYLVAVADLGHFGRAADACFVSQPALSMQIKKLEETLGVRLLERTNKSVMLTDQGAAIAERARNILSQVDEMCDYAKSASDPFTGECRIGIIPTLAPYLLPIIMPKLSVAYPQLTFFLYEEKTPSLIEKLKQGKLHAAIMALPVNEKDFMHTALFEEEFFLAVPKKHPLAELKKVKQSDLQNKNLLLLEEGHCLRDQALEFCHRISANEMQSFRATSLETLRHMVSSGVGKTLMPRLACIKSQTIAYLPFVQPKPARQIGLFWRTTTAKQALLTDLVEKIKAAISS